MRVVLFLSGCLLLGLPLRGRAQGYVEILHLSTEALLVGRGEDGQPAGNLAHLTRLSAVVLWALKADKSQALLLGVNAEAFCFEGDRPGFGVKHLYAISPLLG